MTRPMELFRKPRNRPVSIESTDFDKGTKAIQWRMVFSTDADGTTGPTQAKNESRYRHYTRPPEDNSKRITGLHVKCKTIIHWENNTQEHADDLGLIMTF